MALGRLANNFSISDGTISAININGENYSIGNINEIRQLEMRVQVLENLIKENKIEDKYKIVYGSS